MPIIDVRVDTKNLKRRMNKIKRDIDKAGKATVEQIAQLGKEQIVFYMPKDTTKSARSMAWKVSVNKNGYHSAKIYQGFVPHPNKDPWKGKEFNTVRWMFTSERAKYHNWHNGNILKMREVPANLRKEFRRKVDLSIQKIIQK